MMPVADVSQARIMLIEDNPGDIFLVETALKEGGIPYHLTLFERGKDAVRFLCGPPEENPPIPDVILLDLKTPLSDGFEVLSALRQTPRLAQVQIAILTSSEAASDKHRCSLQHTRFIQKPVQLADFLAAVGQAVKEMLRA